jgi:hypothetical protein
LTVWVWPEFWLLELQPEKVALHRARPKAVPIQLLFITGA